LDQENPHIKEINSSFSEIHKLSNVTNKQPPTWSLQNCTGQPVQNPAH